MAEPLFGQILVVAGASGSGKTRFLKRLAAGDLHPSVMAVLPAGAASWPQIEGWALPRMVRSAPEGRQIDGIVVHYDLWRLRSPGVPRPDPVLAALASTGQLAIITLKISQARLRSHLARRAIRRPDGRLSTGNVLLRRPRLATLVLAVNLASLWRQTDARRLASARIGRRLWGPIAATAHQRHTLDTLAASFRPGWLSGLMAEWATLARTLLPARSCFIELVPDVVAPRGKFDWRVLTVSGPAT